MGEVMETACLPTVCASAIIFVINCHFSYPRLFKLLSCCVVITSCNFFLRDKFESPGPIKNQRFLEKDVIRKIEKREAKELQESQKNGGGEEHSDPSKEGR